MNSKYKILVFKEELDQWFLMVFQALDDACMVWIHGYYSGSMVHQGWISSVKI